MARVAIGGFMHETNSFVPGLTGFSQFSEPADRPPLSRGAAMLDRLRPTTCSTAGFMAEIGDAHELLPLLWSSALAGPPVSEEAYERISAELVGRLSSTLPVDAVYLDLHGAMVAEHVEDGEGELLRRVRAVLGPDVPVAVSLDYHANVTPAMAAHADAIVAYQTYPHVDVFDTGRRAAKAMRVLLARGRPPARAHIKLPFLLPLNFQCTLVEPSRGVVEAVAAAEDDTVLSCAYLAGFPPSDLFYCGPSVVAHGYSAAEVEASVTRLAQAIALKEADFAEPLLSPDEAARSAMVASLAASGPIIIADTQDNPGCGGSGDTTGILEALVRNDAQGAVFGLLCDAPAVSAAAAGGVGAEVELDLGAHVPVEGSQPFSGTFKVLALRDGQFTATGPCTRGRRMDIGESALLQIGGVRIAVSSKRAQTLDQAIYRHFDIEPAECKIVVVKSTCHFRADFGPIAEQVLVAVAPGGYVCDPARHPYRHLRRGVRLSPLGASFDPAWPSALQRGPLQSGVISTP